MVSTNDILNSGVFDFTVIPVDENVAHEASGKNEKKLFIALADDDDPELKSFLKKVMNSVGVDIDADALTVFLTPGQQFSLTQLSYEVDIEKAVFFGVAPARAGLNLNATPYSPFSFIRKTYLFADKLAVIQQNPALKRSLWEALKTIFN